MRTQWTTEGNRDTGSSCSCDRGLHRYLRNFGGGGVEPPTPLGTPLVVLKGRLPWTSFCKQELTQGKLKTGRTVPSTIQ